jgi:hypothetical protein
MRKRAIGGGSACGQYQARPDRARHVGNVPGVTPLFVFIAPPVHNGGNSKRDQTAQRELFPVYPNENLS